MILDTICLRTENFIQQMPKEQRKQYGQFFTSRETARFMASLVIADTIPLIYSCHIKDGRVRFPQGKEGEYLLRGRAGFMQPNRNYLFVKRFTAKEEHRRLQCGIYLSRYQPGYSEIRARRR